MKKLLSIFLSLVVIVSSLSISFEVFAGDVSSIKIENPFYSGEHHHSKFQPLRATSTYDGGEYVTYKGKKYYTEGTALYKIIRDAMAKRQDSVKINLHPTGRIYDYTTLLERFFEEATEDSLSVCSTDGDYARWSVMGLAFENIKIDRDGYDYYYSMEMTFDYYSSIEQERQVDSKINSIVNTVRKKNLSDYMALKYIHDLICDGATYDYDALEAPESCSYAFSAYGILVKGLGVCQGYANAFYRICKELGYNVRFVSSDPNRGCHAWNLIQLDDKFYFVDATWDDEIRDEPEMAEEFDDNSYYYFLVDYDTLRSEDSYYQQHTLYNSLYSDDYYNEKYKSKTSLEAYDFETATGLSTCRIVLSATQYIYNGQRQRPQITVLDKLGNTLDGYTVTYSNSTACGRVRMKLTGKNELDGSSTYRTYNILPSKMTNLKLADGGRTTTSLTLTWSKYAGGATGYQIQRYRNGQWSTIKTVEGVTSYRVTNLSPNGTYTFRIRAYKTINNYKNYGAYSSSYSTVTIPKTVSTPTLSTSKKSIKVKWSKVSCSGYLIQYSTSSSMSNPKSVYVSSSYSSKTISNLKKGKKYYVRIKAYKLYKDKKYYSSSWSNKKSITVK